MNKLMISFKGLRLRKTYDVSKYLSLMTENDRDFVNNSTYNGLVIKKHKKNNFFLDIDGDRGFLLINSGIGVFNLSIFIKDEFKRGTTAFHACAAVMFYMFTILGFNKMETQVISNNRASLKLQYGFLDLEGIVKQTYYDGKLFYDKFLFCMFRKEFLTKYSKLSHNFRMAGNKKTYKVI